MVSKASDDFPEPLKPVITTSLSRGMESVRFLRLCSRAPPILMNSLLTHLKICNYTIFKCNKTTVPKQKEPLRNRFFFRQNKSPLSGLQPGKRGKTKALFPRSPRGKRGVLFENSGYYS